MHLHQQPLGQSIFSILIFVVDYKQKYLLSIINKNIIVYLIPQTKFLNTYIHKQPNAMHALEWLVSDISKYELFA